MKQVDENRSSVIKAQSTVAQGNFQISWKKTKLCPTDSGIINRCIGECADRKQVDENRSSVIKAQSTVAQGNFQISWKKTKLCPTDSGIINRCIGECDKEV